MVEKTKGDKNMISVILNVILVLVILGMLMRFRASPIYFTWKNLSGSFGRIWDNIRRGWNRSEWWGLDTTICRFVLPRLKEFRNNVQGHPSGLVPAEVEENEDENFSQGMEEWKKILDKMIFSFECILNDNEDIDIPHIKFKFVQKNENDKFSYMEYDATPEEIEQHKKDFEVYMKKLNARQEVIQEGLQLFAKYFETIWD
jgi:hypothetical protein